MPRFTEPGKSEWQANIDRRNQAAKEETIGDWSPAKLAKFIENTLANRPPTLPNSIVGQVLTARRVLVVGDRIELSKQALRYIKDNLPP